MGPYRFFDGSGPKFFCRVNGLRESFILYFHSETVRTSLLLGYFAHIVGRERDWIIAKDFDKAKLYSEVTFSSTVVVVFAQGP